MHIYISPGEERCVEEYIYMFAIGAMMTDFPDLYVKLLNKIESKMLVHYTYRDMVYCYINVCDYVILKYYYYNDSSIKVSDYENIIMTSL